MGRRRGFDPVLLWLWCRLAAAAPIWPLAYEPPYNVGAALKKKSSWLPLALSMCGCGGSGERATLRAALSTFRHIKILVCGCAHFQSLILFATLSVSGSV